MQGVKLEIDQSVIAKLAACHSDTQAARHLGIAVSSFFLLRKRYGIPSFTAQTGNRKSLQDGKLLRPGEGTAHPRSRNLNKRCFASIDEPAKAYFLGLLAADGHVVNTSKGRYMAIELKEPDCAVLLHLTRLLESRKKLEQLNRPGKQPSGRIRIYSSELVKDLLECGINSRKEGRFAPPGLSAELRGCYLRGLLDGDGHVLAKKRSLYLCSTSLPIIESVRMWTKEVFGANCAVKQRTLQSGKDFYVITFGGAAQQVLAWAYKAEGPSIERKKREALQWLTDVKQRGARGGITDRPGLDP